MSATALSGNAGPAVPGVTIRPARPEDHAAIGALLVSTYGALPGMPSPEQQPAYYAMLADVAGRAARPALTIFVAADERGHLLGSIDFIADMAQYGSGGSASTITDAAGIRLLAVDSAVRGRGVVMQTAWAMYDGLGFVRFPEIDFQQGSLDVFGFQLDLTAP